jgi:transposase
MRGHLTPETRQKTVITRLKTSNQKLRVQNKSLTAEVRAQAKTIKKLEDRLVDKESQRKELLTYLYKGKVKKEGGLPRGKKVGAVGYHRPKPSPESVTESHTYTLKKCPMGDHSVGDIVDSVTKYTEDIALKPKPIVTEHTITRHWCSHCETYVKMNNLPPMPRIGVKTLGYILYARYRLRLTLALIQESLLDLYDFRISEGEIVEQLKRAESLFGKNHAAIVALIQDAAAVYADETGWRMDGKNWWLWVFVTKTGTQFVLEDTRGRGVPAAVLGNKEDRVIISDGYAAYQKLPGDKQQCWVHLLRVAKIHSPTLYTDLCILYKKLLLELEKKKEERDIAYFDKHLAAYIKKDYPEPTAKKVQNRMQKHAPHLFTCLKYDGVLPENNTAERAIRPQVIMRKIFGGARSVTGAETHAINTSVLTTLRQQNPGVPFFDMMVPLLQERQKEMYEEGQKSLLGVVS